MFAGERAEFKVAVGNDAAAAAFRDRAQVPRAHGGARRRRGRRNGGAAARRCRRSGAVGSRSIGFAVETRYPARLFRAWTWVHMDARCLVYPRPADPGPAAARRHGAAASAGDRTAGDDDFAGLRSAAPGDPPQRIAWKAYARNDQLLLKEFSSGTGEPCLLDWDVLPELGVEQRLSQLARWCLDADAAGRGIALRLPGQDIPPGLGPKHLAVCLEALALFEARRDDAPRLADAPARSLARDQAPPLDGSHRRRHEPAALADARGLDAGTAVDGDRVAVRRRTVPLADSAARRAARCSLSAPSVAVLLQYRTLNGVEAGSALLVVMVALKFLESRNQRDQLVLIMISYFLMFASLLGERGPLVGRLRRRCWCGSRPSR